MKTFLSWLRWRGILVLAALTPTCRQVVRMASRQQEQPLPWSTRFRLGVHLRICTACERYLRQLDVLRQAAARAESAFPMTDVHPPLPAAAKERIKQRLRCEGCD